MSKECTTTEVEGMICATPDYVSEVVHKWFSRIPEGERDKPMLGVGGDTYSPRDILNELGQVFKIELSRAERRVAVTHLSQVTKSIVGEILQSHGWRSVQSSEERVN